MTSANDDEAVVAVGYDAVYRAVADNAAFHDLWAAHACGHDYPRDFAHISFLTLEQMRQMAEHLEVSEGQVFADLACGAGGPGLWVAARTGAQVVGIDLSARGVGAASARARRLGLESQARFAVATFSGLPLATGALDAAMSVDAIQYAPDKHAVFVEAARVLRRGGCFAFHAFELDRARAADLPVIGADPVGDYRPLLEEAGFVIEQYEPTDAWPDRVTAAYEAVLSAGREFQVRVGDEAFSSLTLEMALTLEARPYSGHVSVVARRP